MAAVRSVSGLVCLITGGASGLGRGTAQVLAKQGAKVVIADLPSSPNKESVIQELGKNSLYCSVDVTKEDDVLAALDATKKTFGCLDVVVNCAGIGVARRIFNFNKGSAAPLEEIEKVLKVNALGTMNVVRLAAGLMALNSAENMPDKLKGVFVNTSSVAAFDGQMGQTAYAASKGAIVSMTLPLAREFANAGIRVNTICPGLFDTPLLASLPERVRTFLADTVPFPARLGDPQEFGHLVQFLIENPYINGSVIRFDGALRMQP